MRIFQGLRDVDNSVGEHLGHTPWSEVTQDLINTFADATNDHQWIHVDPERAAAGPFGATVAHGYLTLSMIGGWAPQIFEVRDCSMIVNYGLESVRFLRPVTAGSRVRAGAVLSTVAVVPAARRMNITFTVELEGSDKPALVAETVILAYEANGATG